MGCDLRIMGGYVRLRWVISVECAPSGMKIGEVRDLGNSELALSGIWEHFYGVYTYSAVSVYDR